MDLIHAFQVANHLFYGQKC